MRKIREIRNMRRMRKMQECKNAGMQENVKMEIHFVKLKWYEQHVMLSVSEASRNGGLGIVNRKGRNWENAGNVKMRNIIQDFTFSGLTT